MIQAKTLVGVYSAIMLVMATSISQFAILSLRDTNSIFPSFFVSSERTNPSSSNSSSSSQETDPVEADLSNNEMLLEGIYAVLAERPSVEIFNSVIPLLNETRKPAVKPVAKKAVKKETVPAAPKKEEVKAAAAKPAEKPQQTQHKIKAKAEYQRPLKAGVGVFTSRYGKRTFNGRTRLHAGIDIAAPKGSPIYAAKGGEVTRAGWVNGYGLLIEIKHPDGSLTKYAHCSKLLMKTGDKVEQGTEIAKVGNTGRSTGSHLHFEIVKNGKPVNPYSYVKW